MNGCPFKGESHCRASQVVNCCCCSCIVEENCDSSDKSPDQLCDFWKDICEKGTCSFLIFVSLVEVKRKKMAPVYDFRHVELDKIGRGKRIVKPPGGECSDIFGIQNGTSLHSPDQITPRKAKNYMQSTIFSPDSPDSPYQSGQQTPTTPSKLLDTADRLFGASGDEQTPRKVINRQRSSIFEEEVASRSPNLIKSAPVRRAQINPITGAPVYENGFTNGSHNGTSNGTPNGSMNGHSNGICNGHSSPESPMNGTPRVRNPPGGKSSGIF